MHWFLLLVFGHIYRSPLLLSVYKGLKYLIHITTQTSEIYRLCNLNTGGEKLGPSLAILYRLDQSISYSKHLVAEKRALQEPDCDLVAVTTTVSAKKCLSPAATEVLAIGLGRIHQTNCVLYQVERQVQTQYDTNNTEHEDKLRMLWNKMKPDEHLNSRHTKQWVDIGFQGTDPATDFRGMGIQGLDDLLYFVTRYPQHAHSVLQHASHPVSWYPYAIVGINLTKFAYQLLELLDSS
ncbi:hypothetical protein INT47_012041 [Mucor saturninus]|uniref:ELMO domain-containing protein n=1 Tax=Mucor saturninus TaxID=64648 RepID=A0A8H7QMR0_9FUNG|nr:hypothetical protein INT47_012041 [Mucor saturninus]